MTRDEIVTAVVANTLRSDKVTDIQRGINLAHAEMSLVHDFRSMQLSTTIALPNGTRAVNKPNGCDQIISIRVNVTGDLTQWWPIEFRTAEWVQAHFPNEAQDTNGRPALAYESNDQIVFVPGSGEALTVQLRYYSWFGDLAADDEPTKTVVYPIICWVTGYIFRLTQQFPDSNFWMQEYARSLLLAVRADKRRGAKKRAQGFGTDIPVVTVVPWLDPFNKG